MVDRFKTALTRFTALFELGGPGRIVPMEGLRGVAILMVLLVHHSSQFRGWAEPGTWTDGYAEAAHAVGQAGVDLFFALSGYLVYSLAIHWHGTTAGFIRRRMRRIYPPFLAAMAVYVALFIALPGQAKWPKGGEAWFVVQSLLLLPGVFDVSPVMTVAWSLSYELAFYLAIPLLVSGLGWSAWPRRRRVAAIACLALSYCAASMIWFPGRVDWIPLEFWNHPRFLLFAAGMLAWERFDARRARPERAWTQAVAVALMVCAVAACAPLSNPVYQQPWPSIIRALLLGAASFAVIQASFGDAGWLAAALSWKPLRWLGNCSYSFYLVHSLGVHAAGLLAGRIMPAGLWFETGFWVALPLALVAASAVAIPLYLFVERPFSLRRPALRAG
ncbi:MAG TPA: acyltransferase [Bryobacteraceae bacterium]|nr:acyltransferase [Bryobacteraceae bacterium]